MGFDFFEFAFLFYATPSLIFHRPLPHLSSVHHPSPHLPSPHRPTTRQFTYEIDSDYRDSYRDTADDAYSGGAGAGGGFGGGGGGGGGSYSSGGGGMGPPRTDKASGRGGNRSVSYDSDSDGTGGLFMADDGNTPRKAKGGAAGGIKSSLKPAATNLSSLA